MVSNWYVRLDPSLKMDGAFLDLFFAYNRTKGYLEPLMVLLTELAPNHQCWQLTFWIEIQTMINLNRSFFAGHWKTPDFLNSQIRMIRICSHILVSVRPLSWQSVNLKRWSAKLILLKLTFFYTNTIEATPTDYATHAMFVSIFKPTFINVFLSVLCVYEDSDPFS